MVYKKSLEDLKLSLPIGITCARGPSVTMWYFSFAPRNTFAGGDF